MARPPNDSKKKRRVGAVNGGNAGARLARGGGFRSKPLGKTAPRKAKQLGKAPLRRARTKHGRRA